MNTFNLDKFSITQKDASDSLLRMIDNMVFNNIIYEEKELLEYIRIINDYNKNLQTIVDNIINSD